MSLAHQPQPVTAAAPLITKGDSVVYTPTCGDHEFQARVLTAHKDGSSTIEVQWAVRDESLLMGYFGGKYRVENQQLSARTRAGTPVGRLSHPAAN
jgi:hypothetical protein